jgi:hypothetical protein
MKKDEGSVLVLGIGLMVIAISLITTLVNVATVWIARNSLDAVADGAVLAAVQAVDVSSVYTEGVGTTLRINPVQAKIKASQYVNLARAEGGLDNLRITSLSIGIQSVSVTLSSDIRLPFEYLATSRVVTATSRANAVNKLM